MTVHHLISVRQPWAQAVIDGHKPIENRSRGFTLRYRGRLWIHASAAISDRGAADHRVLGCYTPDEIDAMARMCVLGHVDAVGAHRAEPGCCDTPWAEASYQRSDGGLVVDPVHLELANPVALDDPIRTPGALGIWRSDRYPGLSESLDHAR